MSHQTLETLNTQLAAARAALNTALEAGEGTTEARHAIAHVENEMAALERTERERHAEESRLAAAEVERAAAEAAEQAHEAVEAAATVEGLVELVGEPLPTMERDPEIDAAAAAVSHARATLGRAEDEYRPHAGKVAQLKQRIGEKLSSIDAIGRRRMSGDERVGDAAELALFRNDAAALELLYGDAKSAAAAQDQRPAARDALHRAEQELDRAQKRAVFSAALERVRQAEAVFLDAFGVMVRAGRAAGESSPWTDYQASPDMKRAVTGAILPGITNPFYKG